MSFKVVREPVKHKIAKVPMVIQLEDLECGAACLTMVLAYYGKWIPLEQIRVDCGVSRDGSKAKNILRTARYYGMEAEAYRFEPNILREQGFFPCIIHWNFNHFVVLNGFKGDKAYLNDPGQGSYAVSMEEFDKAFTGVCLFMKPGENFEPGGKQKSMLNYTMKRIKGLESSIVLVAIATAIVSLAAIISQVFGRVYLDKLLLGYNPDWVKPFIIALAVLYFMQVVATCISNVSNYRISGKMSVTNNLSFMWKVLHLPMRFFSQRMSGDLLNRQESNVLVSENLVNVISPLFINFVMLMFYLVVMIRYSPMLTLIGVVSIVICTMISQYTAKKRVNISRVSARDEGKLAAHTVYGIRMMETIKSSGAEEGYFEKLAGYQANVNLRDVELTKLNVYWGLIPMFINSIAGVAILGLGVYYCIKGSFTTGMVAAFQGFFMAFMTPVQTLLLAGEVIQETRTQMERIEDVMEYPDDIRFDTSDDVTTGDYQKLSGDIQIKDLTFGYSPLETPLIKDFNLSIKPGSRVALVGASGCGKSTISKLISGLYQPWSGEILFDGKPQRSIDIGVFTGSVAVVDQDIILFEDTVENNIKMWDSSIEDFEMILAARDAQIHDDIMKHAEGYGYRLLEGGRNLSGGQRQRLEIARVLAQDPTVIILDEATSALDALTEYQVVNAIKDRGITCIVVAHRLSTIRDCDEIIVMDHGVIIERGTHDELIAKGGAYSELITNE